MSFIHVSYAEKRSDIPAMGDGKNCDRPDCKGPKDWEFGYGLAGGGMGVYSYCNTCEQIREKDCDPEDLEM
jgi:hypothetical protein